MKTGVGLPVLLLIALAGTGCAGERGASDTGVGEADAFRAYARFEPDDGRTLLIVGQDKGEMDEYAALDGVADPAGFMMYTNITTLEGMTAGYRGVGGNDGGEMDFRYWSDNYPDTVMNLALYMAGYLDEINTGTWDGNIDDLADLIKASNKPVFLRIGYEADGPWNGYEPEPFKLAWQRIVDRFRARGADNVAYMWHAAAGFDTYNGAPVESWYPGDDYVDWIGVSWFGWAETAETPFASRSAAARETVAQLAADRGKPLAIAEATPRIYHADDPWTTFHEPLFAWIADHNVKMHAYINQNWEAQGMWAGQDWGNSRVQDDPELLARWTAEVNGGRYLGRSETLFAALRFAETNHPKAPVPAADGDRL